MFFDRRRTESSSRSRGGGRPEGCSLGLFFQSKQGVPERGRAYPTTGNNAELTDGNLNQCGVLTMAIANPLFIDYTGDGLYKGVALP